MLAAFWSGLGKEFAQRWAARMLTPAFAFWLGGLAAVWWDAHAAGVRAHGWAAELNATAAALGGLPVLAQGLLVAAGLFVPAVSALAAERLTAPVLRLLEGYWTRPRRLRTWLIARRRRRRDRWSQRVAALALRQRMGTLDTAEYLELRRLRAAPPEDTTRLRELLAKQATGFDAQAAADLGRGRTILRHSPRQDALGMPTRLGDILRAAEQRPRDKYGLDAVACWYALWQVLPAETRTDLVQARTALDGAARTWLWGMLFLVWTPWTWWAPVAGVTVAALAYYVGVLGDAKVFGELMVAAFDMHRFALYDALRLPAPAAPATEPAQDGPRVTNQLWGGLDEPGLHYSSPPDTP
ncbi:hypothetical protein [Nonomuraea jabiensis]|uniref:hypothetical protein n=1 Tax=Nonomuraea jabiensis TaxID=882448 RepID=UPI003D72646D